MVRDGSWGKGLVPSKEKSIFTVEIGQVCSVLGERTHRYRLRVRILLKSDQEILVEERLCEKEAESLLIQLFFS